MALSQKEASIRSEIIDSQNPLKYKALFVIIPG